MTKKSEKVNLRDFVKDNYPLIGTIGIMGALTTFILQIVDFTLLAFAPLALMVISTIELLNVTPDIKESSNLLVSFMLMITLLMFIIAGYIFMTYVVTFYEIFTLGIIFSVSMILYWKLLNKINFLTGRYFTISLYLGEIVIFFLTLLITSFIFTNIIV